MNTQKIGKRIAMIGHKFIPSRNGGVEVVVTNLAPQLVKIGYDVTCYNRTNADFKKARAVNVKGEENRQILIDKGLRKKQVYYLKVYACHKGGKRVFSQPSAVFKKKTK